MPDAGGNIKGISLSGKAGEVLDRIKRQELLDEISAIGQEQLPDDVESCEWCPGIAATHEISGCPACIDCWEKAYNLD
jgi:hypothetical protein